MQFFIKMLHGWAGGSSVFFLHARSVVGPPEVRFAHPVRLAPDTHSQGKAAEKEIGIERP